MPILPATLGLVAAYVAIPQVEGLQKEVDRLDMFAHYFKSVEVKQIEAPVVAKVKPWWRFW